MAKFLFYDNKIIEIFLRDDTQTGGAAIQAYCWIKGLQEAGQEIDVMTAPRHNRVLKDDCQDIHLISLYNNDKGIRWLRWLYYRLPFIYRKIKKAKPNYLYQGVPGWNSFLLGLICKQMGIKYILRIANDNMLDKRILEEHSQIYLFFQNMGIGLSNYVLCQNEYQYQIIKKKYPHKRALHISNPIILTNSEKKVGINARKYIAWLGLFQYQKNLKLLFEIVRLFKNEQFCIAGEETAKCDEDTRYYLNKIKELPNVKFIGFLKREQVLPFLSNASFLLNTSHYEGFSNTFLEAMSVGTPIISSDKVNPDSIISKHQLGIVYHDLNDLQTQYFALTHAQYVRMSNRVIDYVADQHDYKALTNRLINYLQHN